MSRVGSENIYFKAIWSCTHTLKILQWLPIASRKKAKLDICMAYEVLHDLDSACLSPMRLLLHFSAHNQNSLLSVPHSSFLPQDLCTCSFPVWIDFPSSLYLSYKKSSLRSQLWSPLLGHIPLFLVLIVRVPYSLAWMINIWVSQQTIHFWTLGQWRCFLSVNPQSLT